MRTAPVSRFLTVTMAAETGAPVGSETLPVMLDEAWAWSEGVCIIRAITTKQSTKGMRLPKRNNELIRRLRETEPSPGTDTVVARYHSIRFRSLCQFGLIRISEGRKCADSPANSSSGPRTVPKQSVFF